MIVFSEATTETAISKSAQDVHQLTEIAKLAGCQIYFIPKDFSLCENAENALWHIPEQPSLTACLWIGYIPSFQRYCEIYTEALKKNIRLLNSPTEHQQAQEFDLSYPLLDALTPESITITDVAECRAVVDRLPLPLFVRGSVRSVKADGWQACVATTLEELEARVTALLNNRYRSRGRVMLRRLVKLRYARKSDEGFPLGREFRVFLYQGKVIDYAYYWDGNDPLMKVSTDEEKVILNLAQEAAERLNVPFLAVDVGQLEDEKWIVIEVNDAQFAGTAHMELFRVINRLIEEAGR